MDFAALYKSKLTTPEEAVKVVKSGDWVELLRLVHRHAERARQGARRTHGRAGECKLPRRRAHAPAGDFRCAGCCRQADLELLAYVGHRAQGLHGGLRLLFRTALLRAAALVPRERRPHQRYHDPGRSDGCAGLVQLRSAGVPPRGSPQRLPMLLSSRSTSICRDGLGLYEEAESMFPRSI